jgi:hypothetical protein
MQNKVKKKVVNKYPANAGFGYKAKQSKVKPTSKPNKKDTFNFYINNLTYAPLTIHNDPRSQILRRR